MPLNDGPGGERGGPGAGPGLPGESLEGPPASTNMLSQALNTSMISVSKLCCPVCWEVMRSLRGANMDTFVVRGCHSIACIAPLPPWVPSDSATRRGITAKVQRLLRQQVSEWKSLPSGQPTASTFVKGHKPRQQSETSMDYSVRSSSQGSNDTSISRIDGGFYQPGPGDDT